MCFQWIFNTYSLSCSFFLIIIFFSFSVFPFSFVFQSVKKITITDWKCTTQSHKDNWIPFSHAWRAHVSSVRWDAWKRVSFSICKSYFPPASVCGKTAYRKQRWAFISHRRRTPRWHEGCHCGNSPKRRLLSHVCRLYTHWMPFRITHLANRKESQTGLDPWPKTAPFPLCSDKWPTSKSGSLWAIERGRTQSTGND